VAGEGRKEEAGSQKSKDDEGGSVRLAKNPYIIVEDTGGRTQPSGCKQGPLGGCLFLTSQVTCLRESCMRENCTCSLGGGRRLARKRASSDPTIQIGICGSVPRSRFSAAIGWSLLARYRGSTFAHALRVP